MCGLTPCHEKSASLRIFLLLFFFFRTFDFYRAGKAVQRASCFFLNLDEINFQKDLLVLYVPVLAPSTPYIRIVYMSSTFITDSLRQGPTGPSSLARLLL